MSNMAMAHASCTMATGAMDLRSKSLRARGHVAPTRAVVTGQKVQIPRHKKCPGARRGRDLTVCARSRDDGGGGGGSWGKFISGVLVGGAVFGVAGVLFAPQISKTFLKGKGEVGKFLYDDWTEDEEEDSLEKTRQNLNDKIAQLNAAIDNFSTEADRGLSDKITKLNSDMDSLEADITGTGNQTEGAAEKETPTPAESR
mmetsp:Transcript_11924/g.54057  ORF Transcript_11924/g.54057 Transcript_11924/m.54057 type:complete len:200 (+) Transcript_11924:76-675(+)